MVCPFCESKDIQKTEEYEHEYKCNVCKRLIIINAWGAETEEYTYRHGIGIEIK
jgi:transcription initiation factor TFIIIB Brf1 subunit/transcription initiation factor TFIIB